MSADDKMLFITIIKLGLKMNSGESDEDSSKSVGVVNRNRK